MTQHSTPLRFITAGSVDDGKSTLIGRLLYDSKALLTDQIKTLNAGKEKGNKEAIDFSILTDGLEAEREQGITIDVAYRYFSTAKRKFIIADTPGHEQYTRNMVTGASTASAAIVLIDASQLNFDEKPLQLLPQTKRHSAILRQLNCPHILVAVNKMDKPSADPERIKTQLTEHGLTPSEWGGETEVCKISAKTGAVFTERTERIRKDKRTKNNGKIIFPLRRDGQFEIC